MDDERDRPGIKSDLTTRDQYLDQRFTRLSPSGHDLTPLTLEEVNHIIEVKEFTPGSSQDKYFIGEARRGIYVNRIGGLPLFSSGMRIDELCNKIYLYFREPCDETHVQVEADQSVVCARSQTIVGHLKRMNDSATSVYEVDAMLIEFYSVDDKLPMESQPENFWGTEGQYRAWNNHERIAKPLSY